MNVRMLTIWTKDEVVLVYVGNHDETYDWGTKNKPVFTENNIVGFIKEKDYSVGEILNSNVQKYSYLANYGFDEKFIAFLSTLSEDQLLDAIEFISPEYQELILFGPNDKTLLDACDSSIIVTTDDKQLENALKLSISDWCLYLHPRQKYIIDFPLEKNLIIKGGPGTGKTVSLIHRFSKCYRNSKIKKPLFLCCNEYTESVIKEMLKQMSINGDDCIFVFEDFKQDSSGTILKDFFNKFSCIFIDEAQDMPLYLASRINYLLENSEQLPPITMALDLNQSLFSSIGEAIKRLENYFDIINLDYCYRSTKQIIAKAKSILLSSEHEATRKNFQEAHAIQMSKDLNSTKLICALSGFDVQEKSCNTINDLKNELAIFIKENNLSLGSAKWAIVFSGKDCEKTKMLFSEYKENSYTAYEAKGREFFQGIVIFTGTNEPQIKTAKAYKTQILTDYVSISRFRENVLYIKFENMEVY